MNSLKIHGIYKHFKGDYYLVEEVGVYTETMEECVVYRKLYGDGGLWIRPKKMFLREVDHEKFYKNICILLKLCYTLFMVESGW
ncbi:MAG: DUF1653 domain-containing protein [Bacilli bacterium]|nr:DUF1653 domain-containing protein [Bacilli bacterium]MBR1818339.1 DUF1653 domain-containing protein [Bacilli bacterium]